MERRYESKRLRMDSKMRERESVFRMGKVMGLIRLITRRNLKFEFIEGEYSREIKRQRSFKCNLGS